MAPNILHMITPLKHISPFDVNMALDAGYDAVIPYSQVTLEEVRPLVQDAIFSRAPQNGPRTTMFIGGKNAVLALDMMSEAWEAMVPPFAMSVFADPSGAFTTAAAMVAVVEKRLKDKTGSGLAGKNTTVFGGSGVLGFCAAVLATQQGANVRLVGHDGDLRVKRSAADMFARFGVRVYGVDGSSEEKRQAILSDTQIILCAAKAGTRVLSANALKAAKQLMVVADLNAVPPSGVEGINVQDDGVPITDTSAVGIGALVIGNVKYQTQARLFLEMTRSDKAVVFDFRDAHKLATAIVEAGTL